MKNWKLILGIIAAIVAAITGWQVYGAITVAPRLIDTTVSGVVHTSYTGDAGDGTHRLELSNSCRLTNGTGSSAVDLAPYVGMGSTLGTGASETIDVRSYSDIFGNSVTTMTKLKYLWIKNTGTVTIKIGGAAATQLIGDGFLTGATDTFTLLAGRSIEWCLPTGMTVSAGAKDLKILNTSGATSAEYDVVIIGSSS